MCNDASSPKGRAEIERFTFMCGIVGVWSDHGLGTRENVEQRLSTMMAMVSHRGPDGQGVWTDGVVGLAHAKLAVIDLSDAAARPMADAHDTVHIIHNGEIYNYRELRQKLSGLGHRFHFAARASTSGDFRSLTPLIRFVLLVGSPAIKAMRDRPGEAPVNLMSMRPVGAGTADI